MSSDILQDVLTVFPPNPVFLNIELIQPGCKKEEGEEGERRKRRRRRKEREGEKRGERGEKGEENLRKEIRKPTSYCHLGLFPLRLLSCASVLCGFLV